MIIFFFLQNNSLFLIRKMFTNRTMIKTPSLNQKGFDLVGYIYTKGTDLGVYLMLKF